LQALALNTCPTFADDDAGEAAMGVSLSTVNRAHMAYDHGGINALKPKLNVGRKQASHRAGLGYSPGSRKNPGLDAEGPPERVDRRFWSDCCAYVTLNTQQREYYSVHSRRTAARHRR
jgi:hypothetical protein